ncbi:MAG TPA: magnesium transporter CorA family protein [Gemmatimonadales bacterium]|jgi:magnesium transporter|nr:magnesium transporter CorA family protein [Gemmatimonadales bacterium]
MGTTRLVLDGRDHSLPVEVGVERLGDLLADRENRLWLDISDPGPEEVTLLRRTFGCHELALEEVTRPHERPRCDAYSGAYFIVVYAADQSGDAIQPRELNLFWGENYLVTIHRRPRAVLAVLEEARRRWEQHEGRLSYGIACLVYTLFESLVDGYFVVQDRVRERIEGIEGAILTGAEGAAADLFRLRKELLRVPRLLAPTSHVLAEVLRRERTVPEGLRPYFADIQDHAVHVLAEMDTYRDLLGAALDVHVFSAFNRLGRIMQRLTAITLIIMVPNFVASIYGMNFIHLLPPSDSTYGFIAVGAFLMVMVAWGFIHSRMLGWL